MSKRLWSHKVSDEAAELYFYTTGTYLKQRGAENAYELKTFAEARWAVEDAASEYVKDHCSPGDWPFQIEDVVDAAYRIYKEAIENA